MAVWLALLPLLFQTFKTSVPRHHNPPERESQAANRRIWRAERRAQSVFFIGERRKREKFAPQVFGQAPKAVSEKNAGIFFASGNCSEARLQCIPVIRRKVEKLKRSDEKPGEYEDFLQLA